MKLIKPSFEIIEQQVGLEGIYKQIEIAGRTCYKSEDKITENSAKEFVDRMVKSGHGAMLEHGTVYMFIPFSPLNENYTTCHKYSDNKYSVVKIRNEHFLLEKNGCYITTNYRVLVENNWLDDLKFACDLTEWHERRVTVKFTCDRGVTHEFVRHRVFSFAQESTRYCNYSKDKFGNELTFIIPPWCNIPENLDTKELLKLEEMIAMNSFENRFFYNCICAESSYNELISLGYKPQQARVVLPLSIKAEIIMTGFASDWRHFCDLRTIGTTGAPHPQAKELAEPLMNEFINRKYI